MKRFALSAVASLTFVTSASAATVALKVTPTNVRRGSTVVISGNAGDCPAGDQVTLISPAFVHSHDFAGLPALFATVKPGGAFRTSTRIPHTRAPGRYLVTARCGGGTFGIAAPLRVRS